MGRKTICSSSSDVVVVAPLVVNRKMSIKIYSRNSVKTYPPPPPLRSLCYFLIWIILLLNWLQQLRIQSSFKWKACNLLITWNERTHVRMHAKKQNIAERFAYARNGKGRRKKNNIEFLHAHWTPFSLSLSVCLYEVVSRTRVCFGCGCMWSGH